MLTIYPDCDAKYCEICMNLAWYCTCDEWRGVPAHKRLLSAFNLIVPRLKVRSYLDGEQKEITKLW